MTRATAPARAGARRHLQLGAGHGAPRLDQLERADSFPGGSAAARSSDPKHRRRAGSGDMADLDQPAAADRGALRRRALHDAPRGAQRHAPRPGRHGNGAEARSKPAATTRTSFPVGTPSSTSSIARASRNALLVNVYRQINKVRLHAQWDAMKEQILTPDVIAEYHRAAPRDPFSRSSSATRTGKSLDL